MNRSTAAEIDARNAGLTVPKMFLLQLAQQPQFPLVSSMKDGGGWNRWTVSDVAEQAAGTAAGLLADGVRPGERVLLMMRNRPDFHWLDLGAQFVRATPVSIYNSSSPEEIEYLAGHAEARIAILEDDGFLQKMMSVRGNLPLLEKIYVIEPPSGDLPDGVFPVSDLLSHGHADLGALAAETMPDDLATLIYTSGTTGPPKGVMISQYNVVYTADSLFESIENPEAHGWRVVSYLPMAHIAERMTSHYRTLVDGLEVYCCPDPNLLMPYLKEVHPQMLFGVPRVFEKIYAGVNAALAADPEKAQQFADGVAAAIEIKRAQRDGTATQEQLDTWAFLDAVAFSTVRGLVGLDACELAITGAAPLPAEILEWFNAIGVNLAEIYGLSETSGPMTFSPTRNKPGYVGQAIPGCEVRLADDGEVICRG
ncbi:MAG: AMP-dependent synthetase/ligase, partial [Ilumatobacteraceae bacterium]